MLVPAVLPLAIGREQLDEPYAALNHPARQETLASELRRIVFVESVERLGRRGLAAQIEKIGHLGLHAKGQLIV